MKINNKKILFIVVMFFGTFAVARNSSAATVTVGPNDCSAATVNAAISNANPGDTIELTCTGTVSWKQAVAIAGGKTLKGPGSKAANNWPLTVDANGGQLNIITIANDNDQPLNRVTGFKFKASSPLDPSNYNGTGAFAITGRGRGQSPYLGAYRFDNNYLETLHFDNKVSNVTRTIQLNGSTGQLTGLTDNNVFHNCAINEIIEYYAPPGYSHGQDVWNRKFQFGDSEWHFFEDNTFLLDTNAIHGDGAWESSGGGAKAVMRYNYFSCSRGGAGGYSTEFIDGHGPDIGNWGGVTGMRGYEVYQNTVEINDCWSHLVAQRGGSVLGYNNKTSGQIVLSLWEDRAATSEIVGLDWPSLNYYKPCKQAPQAEDFSQCWPLPYGISASSGGNGNVTQTGELGTVYWNNGLTPEPTNDGPNRTYVQENREYWNAAYGTEASLPSTCIADNNHYYGTTDTNKLYKCTSANNWTLVYSAYTYPHPLRGTNDLTPPSAPSGLTVN